MWAGVAWWFGPMLSRFFQIPPALGAAGFVAAGVVWIGLYTAAFAAWVAWLARRRAAGPLLVAAGWVACELARSRVWVGCPWALAAYSQAGAPRLLQIADAAGPYGVGWLVAAVNASVAGLVEPALRPRRPWPSVAAVALALAATLVYGGWRLGRSYGTGEPFQVAVVQGGEEPRSPTRGGEARVATYVTLTRGALAAHPRLVVWPENAFEGFLQEGSAARDAVLALSRDSGADVILGGPYYTWRGSGPRFRNAVFLVRDGRLAGRYDKFHLVPFAERRYEPGPGPQVLYTAVGPVGAFVCFEAMYPERVRGFAARGAVLLANLSNDAWLGAASAAEHHLAMAALRAVENRRWLVRATTTGISAVVDPRGRITARTRYDGSGILVAPVRVSAARTPYQRWGDAGAWTAMSIAIALSLWHGLRSTQPS
jgi:apolipoprotein N-acyltransferase